jgi:hypothetical protein
MINLSKNDVPNYVKTNQLDPAPEQINTENGLSMWTVKGYRIWARTYTEAITVCLPLIEAV